MFFRDSAGIWELWNLREQFQTDPVLSWGLGLGFVKTVLLTSLPAVRGIAGAFLATLPPIVEVSREQSSLSVRWTEPAVRWTWRRRLAAGCWRAGRAPRWRRRAVVAVPATHTASRTCPAPARRGVTCPHFHQLSQSHRQRRQARTAVYCNSLGTEKMSSSHAEVLTARG